MSCKESLSVKEWWIKTDRYDGPTVKQIWSCRTPEWLPLSIISGFFFVLTLIVILYNNTKFERYRWSKVFTYTMTKRVLSYYMIYSLLNVLMVINPRSSAIYTYVGDVIEAVCMVNFYMLLWSYTGGVYNTVKQTVGCEVNLGQPPFCCLRCVPNRKIDERFLRIMESMLLQLPGVQMFVGLVHLTLVQNGFSPVLGEHWATTLIIVILTISALISIYAIGMLHTIWARFIIGRQIAQKFAVFKATILLAKLQDTIFGFVARGIKPYGYLAALDRTKQWSAFITVVECFIFAILAARLYKVSDFEESSEPIASYDSNKETVDIEKKLEEQMEDVDLGNNGGLVIQNPNV